MLCCEECGCEADVDTRAPGWRAYILPEPISADDARRVIVYCPVCSSREFGSSLL